MKRGDLYRVQKPGGTDPKKFRVFVVASRQVVIDSAFSTVTCIPIYSNYDGISTQVPVGPNEGLKHQSAIHCDELMSLPKSRLTNFIGTLPENKLNALAMALKVALALE